MEFYVNQHVADTGDGSQLAPFKKIEEVFEKLQTTSDQAINYKIFTNNAEGWAEVSKAQIKKLKKTFLSKPTKSTKDAVKQINENFETISLNHALPEAQFTFIDRIKCHVGKRVIVKGFVQNMRKQSKNLWFITLRDGTGYLQCVLQNKLCKTKEASQLQRECSIHIYGTVIELPSDNKTVGGIELDSDHWELIGSVEHVGGIESKVNADSEPDVQFTNRHLMIRGENTSKVIKMSAVAERAFLKHYENRGFTKVNPPTLVQNQCEGGSSLFKMDYFGEETYLSQSSQLYLETVAPVFGNVFSITRSYRAEQSRTRRHLSEYIHIEAESGFITFEDLLNQVEDLLVDVSKIVLELDRETLLEVNPDYKPLKKPFKRLEYKKAIEFLKDYNIQKPEGGHYEFGEDIPEAAERRMTDIIGEPIMLIKFPAEIKSFYMSRCQEDSKLTESVDVLIPGVGEIIGGSMRIWDYNELMDAYKRENIDPKHYYWYTDMRVYGSNPHGGYGLGFERFLTWMLNKEHIRDVCLYPRYTGRCKP